MSVMKDPYQFRSLQRSCSSGTAICCAGLFLGACIFHLQDSPLLMGMVLGGLLVNINMGLLGILVAAWAEKGRAAFAPLLYLVRLGVYALGLFLAFRIGGKALPGYGLGVLCIVPALLIYVLRHREN